VVNTIVDYRFGVELVLNIPPMVFMVKVVAMVVMLKQAVAVFLFVVVAVAVYLFDFLFLFQHLQKRKFNNFFFLN
jgi:hypothetical protein